MSAGLANAFWARFLGSSAAAGLVTPRLYDTMRIGSRPEDADLGAALILGGRKTATSSLSEDYEDPPGPPFVGALSIVVDGSGAPVAVVETIEIERRRLADLDEAFARDYGEWDRTAATLRTKLAAHYRPGLSPADWAGGGGPDLLCERFRVIYSE